MASTPPGSAWLCGPGLVHVWAWPRRVADDQFGLQGYLCGGAAVVAVREKHVDGRPAGGGGWSRHRRQLGAGEAAERDVVDADDADVLRHPYPVGVQALDQADGHEVVVGEHRRHAGADDLLGDGDAAALGGWVGPDDREVGAGRARRVGRRAADLLAGPRAAGAGDQCDLAVTEAGEVFDGEPGALGDVHHDAGQAGDLTVDDDQRHLAAELLDEAVAHPRAAEQDPVDLLGQRADQLLLDGGVLVGVGDEDVVVAVAGLALGGLDQRWEERVGDVGHDQTDVVRPPGDQRPGRPVGAVTEMLGAGQHPAAGLRVDEVRRRERAGDRGDVHPGLPCDVADRGWHANPFGCGGRHSSAPINANGCVTVNGSLLRIRLRDRSAMGSLCRQSGDNGQDIDGREESDG